MIRSEVQHLSKSFPFQGSTMQAVSDVSFAIRKGEFVALLGPSGCGKSTILNMIATLLRPSGGEITIDGQRSRPDKTNPNVGYVFQRDTLFPWRTVADNVDRKSVV